MRLTQLAEGIQSRTQRIRKARSKEDFAGKLAQAIIINKYSIWEEWRDADPYELKLAYGASSVNDFKNFMLAHNEESLLDWFRDLRHDQQRLSEIIAAIKKELR